VNASARPSFWLRNRSRRGVIGAIVKDGVEVESLQAGERGSLISTRRRSTANPRQVGDVVKIIAAAFARSDRHAQKLGTLVVHD